ncbi:MAG: ATP-dependent sacrificial sulfur transferase LarE [Anaerolineae bacterium]|nr:ATP-dependent sacrificial sulfur transferase LarE [Anaerolineae bacterium]
MADGAGGAPDSAAKGKQERLLSLLQATGGVVVAYSGGVDSTYLLAASLRALGREGVLAVTAQSETYPASELQEARELASRLGARHRIILTDELTDERFRRNPPDRCFFCKTHLFEELWQVAREEGLPQVIYGATVDDLGDHRPGMRAAQELGARAPLIEAGLTKIEVRMLSRDLGLPTWDKPAMACLASRFPYHSSITGEGLRQVEQAEDLLRRKIGLRQVRVRHHGDVARLEVEPADFGRLIEQRHSVVQGLKQLGYRYVALDLQGFRSGSMNEVLAAEGAARR